MNEEKVRIAVQRSKTDLLNYFNSIISKTSDDSLKKDLRQFYAYIDRFEPCNNLDAIELDRKIKVMIDMYRDTRFSHDTIRTRSSGESVVSTEIARDANAKMFDRVADMVENMLTERKEIDNFVELDKKALKGLSDFERGEYESRKTQKEKAKEKWEVEAKLVKYEMKRLSIVYERKRCEKLKDIIYDEWDADEGNAEAYQERLAHADNQIAALNSSEKTLIAEMGNLRGLKELLTDLDVEQFVAEPEIAGQKIDEYFKSVAGKTKELQKERQKRSNTINTVLQTARENRADATPAGTSAEQKSKYELERERRRALKEARELGAPGIPEKSEAEREKTK